MPNQPAAGPPHPQIRTTVSPSPCTSYASVTSPRSIVAISVLRSGDRGCELDAAVRGPRPVIELRSAASVDALRVVAENEFFGLVRQRGIPVLVLHRFGDRERPK